MGYETDLKLFIDGVWKAGEGRDAHTVVNPVDAKPIAEVPYATKADLEEALAASERAWPEWRAMDVEKRGAILHKAAQLLRDRADIVARTMTQEQGKPLTEAKLEVLASAQLFDWYAEDAKRDYGRTLVRPAGQLSRVIRQPVGPTATFTPWNFPIYLLAKKVSCRARGGLHSDLSPATRNAGGRNRAVPSARRCRHSKRRRAARPRRFRAGQRDADRQPRHPQGELHRLDRRRQAPDAPLRGQHDARDDGARRPRPGADLRRLRPREDARHGRAAEVSERRPGVRLADALLRPARHLRRLRQGLRRAHRQGEGRQRPRGRREDGSARQLAPSRRDREPGPGRKGEGRPRPRRGRTRRRRLLLPADAPRRRP